MYILAQKWSKIAAPKNLLFWIFFSCLITLFIGLFAPLPEVQCQNVLDMKNPWGKVMERSGLKVEHSFFKNGLKLPWQNFVFKDFFQFVHSV